MAQEGNRKIFFAWQSDTKSEFNKDLVWRSLIAACAALNDEPELGPEREGIVADRDTKGVAGSGDIHRIIFDKLDRTDLALFDITAIAKSDGGKSIPNPNVMLELGYATKSIGESRIVLVANQAAKFHGDLPFDLRNRRVIFYRCSRTEQVPESITQLTAQLGDALREMSISMPERQSQESSVLTLLRQGAPGCRDAALREARRLAGEMIGIGPVKTVLELDKLIDLVGAADRLVTEFLTILDVCLSTDQVDAFVEATAGALEALTAASEPGVDHGLLNARWVDFQRTIARLVFMSAAALCARSRNWLALRQLLMHEIEYFKDRKHLSAPFQRIWLYPSYMARDLNPYLRVMTAAGAANSNGLRPSFDELRDVEMLVALFEEGTFTGPDVQIVRPWTPYLVVAKNDLAGPIERAKTSTRAVRDQMALLNCDWQSLNKTYAKLKGRLAHALSWTSWAFWLSSDWPSELARE